MAMLAPLLTGYPALGITVRSKDGNSRDLPVVDAPQVAATSLANVWFAAEVLPKGLFNFIGLNNAGQVLVCSTKIDLTRSIYLWEKGVLSEVITGIPEGVELRANNSLNAIVGRNLDGGPALLWRCDAGAWTLITLPNTPAGGGWTPTAINDARTIVGFADWGTTTYNEDGRLLRWDFWGVKLIDGGGFTKLTSPYTFLGGAGLEIERGGFWQSLAYPAHLNNCGTVAGRIGASATGLWSAATWNGNELHVFQSQRLKGTLGIDDVVAVNDLDQAVTVTWSLDAADWSTRRCTSTFWDPMPTPVPALASDQNAEVKGMNILGQMIGLSWADGDGGQHPVVWDNLEPIELSARLIEEADNKITTLIDVLAINDKGDIVCTGMVTDPDWEYRIIVLRPIRPAIAVDANRDGTIEPAENPGDDATSAANPYRFWINDDDDEGYGPSFPWGDPDPEHYPARRADSADQIITGARDCEDLTRIWINAAGLIDMVKDPASNLYLGLKWKNTHGTHPSIRLFRAADPDGSLGHIKDALIGAQQAGGAPGSVSSMRVCLGDADAQATESIVGYPWTGITTVEPPTDAANIRDADFVFRKDALPEIFEDQTTGHLLFEGVQEGKGELMLVVVRKKPDGTWEKVSDGGSVWLQLDNIRRMYVRAHSLPLDADWPLTWRVGSPPAAPYEESTDPNQEKALSIPDVRLWYAAGDSKENTSEFSFVPSPGEQNKCVVFVHGIDLNVPTQQGYAQSFFKRLWWQGYRGRFVAFRWSTVISDDGPFGAIIGPIQPGQEWFSIFNSGEYRSWKCGSSLRKFVDALRDPSSPFYFQSGATISVLAHSLGNACASEALRQGMQVDSYVALKAAVPLSCYYPEGTAAPTNTRLIDADAAHPTPEYAGLYNGYHGYLSSIGAANKVNYFEPNDFWLETGSTAWGKSVDWVTNEAVYKPDDPMRSVPNSGVIQYFWDTSLLRGYFRNDTFYRFVKEPHESMAHVSRPRTSALGAGTSSSGPAPRPPNFDSELDMSSYGIGRSRHDHSPLFQRDIQLMYGDARGTAWGEPLYRRLMRDLHVN